LRCVRSIPLYEGLPEDDAIVLLRDLDPQGTLGLRDALEGDLRRAAQLTRGIPHALEILAGILHQDPSANLTRILADEDLFGRQVVEQLVAEGYRRLGEDERRVMEALAVFDRPVDETAVAYLLHPWFPGFDIQACLRRLVSSYFVSASRVTSEYSLHPLDRDCSYRHIPDSPDKDEEPNPYNRRNLELRAANFYVSIRKPKDEWKTIDDLTPQLAEFGHRVRAGDYDGAYQVLDQVNFHLYLSGHFAPLVEIREELMECLTDPGLRAANLGELGLIYRLLGQAEKAVKFQEEALTIARQTSDRQNEGVWLGNLGVTYRELGQAEKAIKLQEEALAIACEAGDRRNEGVWLGNLGITYLGLGQAERAACFHEHALVIAREIGDRRAEGVSLGNLSSAYRELGQDERALEFCERALAVAREIGDRSYESTWLCNMGIIYCDLLGQDERAIEFYEEALTVAREIGKRAGEGRCLDALGRVHCNLGQAKRAIEFHEQALDIARENGDRRAESYGLLGLGRALLAAGASLEAQRRCAEALALDMSETSYLAALVLGIALLHQRGPAGGIFADAVAHCRTMLERTAGLYKPRYTLAAALVGSMVCDPCWAEESKRAELLASVLAEYRRAMENCAAPGAVRDARHDLGMIRTAGVDGLESVFELLGHG
jgi:tetratricopeptide (TPR) repeat protein